MDNDGRKTNPHSGHRARLRKIYMDAPQAMLEHQLLELLLTYALPRRDVNPLAHELISRYGSLAAVLTADVHELAGMPGVGENTAVLLTLAGRLSSDMPAAKILHRLNTPAQAQEYCRALLGGERYETMYVISLDKKRSVLHSDKISVGTLNETVVYPRLVAECALRHRASSVILAHNHPSGDVTPSRGDVETTAAVLAALTPIGISLFDHIIIGGTEAYSMVRGAALPGGETAEPLKVAAENTTKS